MKLEHTRPWDSSNVIDHKSKDKQNLMRKSQEQKEVKSREMSSDLMNLEVFIAVKKKKIPYETLRIHLE